MGSFDSMKNGLRSTRRVLFCYSLGLNKPQRLNRSIDPVGRRAAMADRVTRAIPFRGAMRQFKRHRPGFTCVNPGALRMGCQAGLDSIAIATASNNPLYGSLPMSESPHVGILRAAMELGRELRIDEIMSSSYWSFAQDIIRISGDFFGARTDQEVIRVTRNFIDWATGSTGRAVHSGGSSLEDHILVAHIAGSSMFQVVDGHHRVAVEVIHGNAEIRVRRTWLSAEAPRQYSANRRT